jgi:hypothetical protein
MLPDGSSIEQVRWRNETREERKERLARLNWLAPRELPEITVQGRTIMVRATSLGLYVKQKRSKMETLVSWESIVSRVFGPGFMLPAKKAMKKRGPDPWE